MASMNANADLYKQTLSYRKTSAPRQCLTQPWFVRGPQQLYYPRYNCFIQPLICGQEVFKKISEDIENAKESVDIITWGFDPGMVLVRGSSAEDGIRYGDLLKKVAARANPVKVRILVWHDDPVAQMLMNNNPGYNTLRLPGAGIFFNDYYSDAHQTYNDKWYAEVCAGEVDNIHLHVRDVPKQLLEHSLTGENAPSNFMANRSKAYATHHQKMVLIDYELPKLARGYVMGHNSVTDFWDTSEHKFRDVLRERFYTEEHAKVEKAAWKKGEQFDEFHRATPDAVRRKERAVQHYIDAHSHVAKPYQDVSCRVRGPILYDLNHNFCQAWQESKRPSSLFRELCWLAWLDEVRTAIKVVKKIGDKLHKEMDHDFIERRKKIPLNAFDVPYGHHTLQLLRTQPLHGEKCIKECYANLTRQTFHYMFIQNQYIQYEPWAAHLIECQRRLRDAGYVNPIYVFILTSTPENDGMDIPTYDVASRLGMSTTMRVEHEKAVTQSQKRGTNIPITAERLADRGINIFMGSLWTCAEGKKKLRSEEYEEIYIHAKVAIVDDAAFTIGSANLNLRSMALDSELNVLSDASDVAYQLRIELFSQCSSDAGPTQFAEMGPTFARWTQIASQNKQSMENGRALVCQLLPFHVDRKPGDPVV
jgi:phosphatidylserine/phosphatidylglycerophosphate/cardiolipin synthase-like enzyme